MYRPEGWPEIPCNTCEDAVIDDYGYACEPSCGERARYFNFEAGADAYEEAIWKMAKESPTGTFTFDTNAVEYKCY